MKSPQQLQASLAASPEVGGVVEAGMGAGLAAEATAVGWEAAAKAEGLAVVGMEEAMVVVAMVVETEVGGWWGCWRRRRGRRVRYFTLI